MRLYQARPVWLVRNWPFWGSTLKYYSAEQPTLMGQICCNLTSSKLLNSHTGSWKLARMRSSVLFDLGFASDRFRESGSSPGNAIGSCRSTSGRWLRSRLVHFRKIDDLKAGSVDGSQDVRILGQNKRAEDNFSSQGHFNLTDVGWTPKWTTIKALYCS